MIILAALFLAVCFLSYSNGSNDNFKGVATLFGSKTSNYRAAIWWATCTTFIGSICSFFLAGSLVKTFSGAGLVPAAIAVSPHFLLAVALGAGSTVMLASVTGFPVSTTHGLTGALIGCGLMAVGTHMNFSVLGKSFFVPLLLSPLMALVLGAGAYFLFHAVRIRLGVTKELCLCIGMTEQIIPVPQPASVLSLSSVAAIDAAIDTEENCMLRYNGNLLGVNFQKTLDFAHYITAGIVSFARGLNDTPKMVALLLTIKALGIQSGTLAIAIGIAAGGLLNAGKVAETMSHRITTLNHGQGFTANIVTGALVIFASRLGLPVSTTHVSVGSIFGMGLISGKADYKIVSGIVLSWLLTLPIAAILSGFIYWILK